MTLDGTEWQLRGCLGEEWRWHVGPEKAWDAAGWLPARVPGSVMDDLVRAGEAPSPYHERSSLELEWVPERAWVYRRRFSPLPGRSTLRFDGVDYACTVFVDGRELARHESMFRPFDVDVSAFADGAEHLLAVVVHPAPAGEPQVGRTATLAPLLGLPPARIELDGGTVRNTGKLAALGVVLETQPGDDLLDNVLDLLPGESRDVGAAPGMTADGWNARA